MRSYSSLHLRGFSESRSSSRIGVPPPPILVTQIVSPALRASGSPDIPSVNRSQSLQLGTPLTGAASMRLSAPELAGLHLHTVGPSPSLYSSVDISSPSTSNNSAINSSVGCAQIGFAQAAIARPARLVSAHQSQHGGALLAVRPRCDGSPSDENFPVSAGHSLHFGQANDSDSLASFDLADLMFEPTDSTTLQSLPQDLSNQARPESSSPYSFASALAASTPATSLASSSHHALQELYCRDPTSPSDAESVLQETLQVSPTQRSTVTLTTPALVSYLPSPSPLSQQRVSELRRRSLTEELRQLVLESMTSLVAEDPSLLLGGGLSYLNDCLSQLARAETQLLGVSLSGRVSWLEADHGHQTPTT